MTEKQDFQELNKRIDKMSKDHEVFSNPIRTLIISLLLTQKEMNWTQIKSAIETINHNTINPNTLSFHIGKLAEMEYIEKVGTKEQPIYRIKENSLPKIVSNMDPTITEILQRRF